MRASVANSSIRFISTSRAVFSSALSASDAELVASLSKEISEEKTNEEASLSKLPADIGAFLTNSGFSIAESAPGTDEIELIKKNGGETIRVYFAVSDVTENSNEIFEEGEVEAENEIEDGPASPIRINIVVSKDNAESKGALSIEAISQDDVFLIENVVPYVNLETATANSANGEFSRRLAYRGPSFENLDEGLQSAFEVYLESRGINVELAQFITEYSYWKENVEYVNWLSKVKSIIEA
ncbi:mitochondrial glyco protein [Nadsonia fulvescens var. elongata DSM 6958]|uniref:Mitochondrial glyco protein n=1 Tax=Nadsonia fulvescens var. elongata DSM 6958 TaxID=857566 RepID=A0A1E3PLZ1_9ASCO|nr:mitochondrial glyco protein [Nadsonia fulvescens var. elongata DSM 6958]